MDMSRLARELDEATSFELYRLQSMIDAMLDDPKRIERVRRTVSLGDEVEYFSPDENKTTRSRLLQFRRSRVVVEDLDDGKRWNVPYCALNLEETDVSLPPNTSTSLGRSDLSVGDQVGFRDRDGRERYGMVTRLNPKTVTLRCEDQKWRVAYSFLFQVFDASVDGQQQLCFSKQPARALSPNDCDDRV